MGELSNNDLVISDGSIAKLLSSLDKDDEVKALLIPTSTSLPLQRSTAAESSFITNNDAQPAAVRTEKANGTRHGGKVLLWILVIAAVLIFAFPRVRGYFESTSESISAEEPISDGRETIQSVEAEETETGFVREYEALFAYNKEDVEAVSKALGCSLACDGKVLKLESDVSPDQLLPTLKEFLDNSLTQLIEEPTNNDFISVSANDAYSEIVIVVTAVNINMMEQEAVDHLLVYASIYNNISESGAASVRILFNNMLGNTVRMIDSADF